MLTIICNTCKKVLYDSGSRYREVREADVKSIAFDIPTFTSLPKPESTENKCWFEYYRYKDSDDIYVYEDCPNNTGGCIDRFTGVISKCEVLDNVKILTEKGVLICLL